MPHPVPTQAARLWLLLCAMLLAATPAFAQNDGHASVDSFAPDYFAASQPPSALEMVQLLPGFRLQEGDTAVRGYSGAVGNILIDGRPPASKQDKLEDILKRIPRAQVARIELIHPGAAGIDMQGFPLLANVVRRETSSLRGRVEGEDMMYRHDLHSTRLAAELSLGSVQILDLAASMARTVNDQMGGYGPRDRYFPNGAPQILASYTSPRREDAWTVSGVYRQPLLGGPLRLNALYRNGRNFADPLEARYFPILYDLSEVIRDLHTASEFGTQYTHGLWSGAETEFIAIRRDNYDRTSNRLSQPGRVDASSKHADSSETIARMVLRQRGETVSVEAGAEGALNTLANHIGAQRNGVAVALLAANVNITEQRAELFSTVTWHITSALTTEAGLRYEISHLKQSGDTQLVTDLAYLKPRILTSYQPWGSDEFRILLERDVGQLNFNDFVASVMLTNDTVSAGNKDRVPYTLWRSEAAWEHRFAPGSLVLSARREWITDVVDRIPIYTPGGIIDAVGNIGNGRREEFRADLLMPLERFDLTGMTLQTGWLWRASHVRDPTTFERRAISNDVMVAATASLVHDIPAWKSRWGVTWTHGIAAPSWRFNEVGDVHTPEQYDVFVEYKPSPQWLIRLFGENVNDRVQARWRHIYPGARGVVPESYYELRRGSMGGRIGINIQRTFGN